MSAGRSPKDFAQSRAQAERDLALMLASGRQPGQEAQRAGAAPLMLRQIVESEAQKVRLFGGRGVLCHPILVRFVSGLKTPGEEERSKQSPKARKKQTEQNGTNEDFLRAFHIIGTDTEGGRFV